MDTTPYHEILGIDEYSFEYSFIAETLNLDPTVPPSSLIISSMSEISEKFLQREIKAPLIFLEKTGDSSYRMLELMGLTNPIDESIILKEIPLNFVEYLNKYVENQKKYEETEGDEEEDEDEEEDIKKEIVFKTKEDIFNREIPESEIHFSSFFEYDTKEEIVEALKEKEYRELQNLVKVEEGKFKSQILSEGAMEALLEFQNSLVKFRIVAKSIDKIKNPLVFDFLTFHMRKKDLFDILEEGG